MAGSVLATEMNRMCLCVHSYFGDHWKVLPGDIGVPAMTPGNTGPIKGL